MRDLISIIVLIYRVEAYLSQCIYSIMNQTYRNIEIILVDDGSDDGCSDMCDMFAEKDSRIKVIHKKNGGIDDARKAGILASTGKYVGYVDGDDWIDPNMYERLMYYIETFHVDIVESGVIDSWGDVEKRRVSFFEEGCYKDEKFSEVIGPRVLYSGKFFQHGLSPYLVTKLFLKEKLLKYQMMPEPSNNIVDDTMCTFPCIIESRSLYITHECYYHYRVREDSAKRLTRKDIAPMVMKCYRDWAGRFEGARPNDNMERQIQYFTMYLLIAKAIHVFDNAESEFYLSPFGKIKKQEKIILYGAGTVGIHLEHYIKNVPGNHLVYWADCNYEQLGRTLNVHDPRKIMELEFDYIIISILTAPAVESARRDLINLGVPAYKILSVKQEYMENPLELLHKARYEGERFI